MLKKTRCLDCGTWTMTPRCPPCKAHWDLRKKYINPIQKKRSQYLEKVAKLDKRNARHCLRCHHLRRRRDFLIFANSTCVCVVCRDEDQEHARRTRYGEGIL